jgi:hypothetical protein
MAAYFRFVGQSKEHRCVIVSINLAHLSNTAFGNALHTHRSEGLGCQDGKHLCHRARPILRGYIGEAGDFPVSSHDMDHERRTVRIERFRKRKMSFVQSLQ